MLKMILTLATGFIFICEPSLANELLNQKLAAEAVLQKFYLELPEIQARVSSPKLVKPLITTILSEGIAVKNGVTTVELILALSPLQNRRPISDWSLSTVRILQYQLATKDAPESIRDVTFEGLPEGRFKFCFLVESNSEAKQKHDQTAGVSTNGWAGKTCFDSEDRVNKLYARLRMKGILKRLVPQTIGHNDFILSESTPEVCDAYIEDREKTAGFCPWSANFDGVYSLDGEGKQDHLF